VTRSEIAPSRAAETIRKHLSEARTYSGARLHSLTSQTDCAESTLVNFTPSCEDAEPLVPIKEEYDTTEKPRGLEWDLGDLYIYANWSLIYSQLRAKTG
jgi:hypothetical protein